MDGQAGKASSDDDDDDAFGEKSDLTSMQVRDGPLCYSQPATSNRTDGR